MPLDLYYHQISPPSKAVLATAKYLKLDINVKEVDLFGGETRTAEYLKVCLDYKQNSNINVFSPVKP